MSSADQIPQSMEEEHRLGLHEPGAFRHCLRCVEYNIERVRQDEMRLLRGQLDAIRAERDAALARAEKAERERDEARTKALEAWVDALDVNESWPVADMLEKLAGAAEHLLRDHDCDAHGWEEVSGVAIRARSAAKAIRETFARETSETKREPSDTAEAKCATCGGERSVVFCACGCGLTEEAAVREAIRNGSPLNRDQIEGSMKTERRPCPDCGGSGVRR